MAARVDHENLPGLVTAAAERGDVYIDTGNPPELGTAVYHDIAG